MLRRRPDIRKKQLDFTQDSLHIDTGAIMEVEIGVSISPCGNLLSMGFFFVLLS